MSERYQRLSSGHRFGVDGYMGSFNTGSDTDGEYDAPVRQRNPNSLRAQRARGKGGIFNEVPVSSNKHKAPVRSYWKGVPTKRGSLPRWQANGTGVPTRSKCGVGYWYPNHKQDDNGMPVSVWFFYDQNDGPYSDLRFNDKFPEMKDGPSPFWVKRTTFVNDNGEDSPLSQSKARTLGLEDDHPRTNVERVRGLTLGFRFITDLQLQPGRRESDRFDRRSSARSSASSSRASTPPLRADYSVRPRVSFAEAASGASSGASSRGSSPNREHLFHMQQQLDALSHALQHRVEPTHRAAAKPQPHKSGQKQPENADGPRPLHLKNLSGGVDPSTFFEVPGNSQEDFKSLLAIVPTKHYLAHVGDIVPDGEWDGSTVSGNCTLTVSFPMTQQSFDFLKSKDWASSAVEEDVVIPPPPTPVVPIVVPEPKEVTPLPQREKVVRARVPKDKDSKPQVSTPFGDATVTAAPSLFNSSALASATRSVSEDLKPKGPTSGVKLSEVTVEHKLT